MISIPQIRSGVTNSITSTLYTSVLTLSNIALTDAGTYTCTATYSLSDGSSPVVLTGNIDVTVRGFESHPADVIADLGSDVTANCIVVGDQLATISW